MIKKMIVFIGFIYVLVVPVLLFLDISSLEESLCVSAIGTFLIIISNFEALRELSIGPLRAKMQDKIKEATVTLEELKEITAALSENTLTQLMASNFWDGMTLKRSLKFMTEF